MKGIVFTEFFEMVEKTFSYEMSDKIIRPKELPSGGVYTSVGTYQAIEMKNLVKNLAEETKIPEKELYYAFGQYLFGTFLKKAPAFFDITSESFNFLKNIETFIHIEVRKLYPDAELPKFEYEEPNENELIITYISERNIPDLARGLMNKTFEFFNEKVDLRQEDLEDCTKFYLKKVKSI